MGKKKLMPEAATHPEGAGEREREGADLAFMGCVTVCVLLCKGQKITQLLRKLKNFTL